MRCFNHSEKDAVGLCRNCLKGLCHDCVTSIGNGLACTAHCEERVKALDDYNDLAMSQGSKALNYMQKNTKRYSAFALSFGILVLFFGLLEFAGHGFGLRSFFYVLLGTLFIFYGWRQRQAAK